ncbi:hypothetical protein PENSOL_c052G06015 [Penicillium solitum]|uniref:Rhodopsin domain-containing protein n=1 Tax=Penicillium solitum TaxID=60172 RepID=A0A1V6QQJ8_9EURO|nr:uncharacterized protein PENSOL_c052G06015 [Penicillium solitum]OQD91498.1 hypothetical protein PENSOL_c052G06015 [Penicillium solitum]
MDGLPTPQGIVTELSVNGLIAVTWAGAGLGILFTSARIAIRMVYVKRLLADDYFMLLALAFLITNAILQTLQAPHLYYMVLNMTGPDIVHHGLHYTYYEFAIIGVFWSVLWSVKASFLALFWMISNGLPRYRRVWWATVVFAAVAYIGCWIASVYTCHPPSNYFKFVMSLPLRIIWQAKINMQQKIGLVIVFCLGIVIVAAAIIRAVAITGKAYSDQAALAVWSIVESSISIIVGCLPPFRAIISTKPNTNQSPYGSSGATPNSYDRNHSARGKHRSDAASWSEPPLPLHDLGPYQNSLDYRTCAQDVYISGGQIPPNNVLHSAEEEALRGDIKMVQEFFIRALAYGERVCQESEDQSLPISGNMWLRIGNMVMDSTVEENEQGMWNRYTGFDEAWGNLSEHPTL